MPTVYIKHLYHTPDFCLASNPVATRSLPVFNWCSTRIQHIKTQAQRNSFAQLLVNSTQVDSIYEFSDYEFSDAARCP
jgi:hypothetical protein